MATAGAALVALSVTSRALQSRVQAQLASATGVVSRGDMALNPAILANVRAVISADVITFAPGGRVVASTVGDDRARVVAAAAKAIAAGASSEPASAPADCGVPCLIVYRAVEGRPGFIVALVADTSELSSATRAVTRTIVFGAALSALLMMLVGQFVVHRVTAPLHDLVRFARELPAGDFRQRAPVRANTEEIRALAEAFDGMLDRLQHSHDALVRSEKLALTGLLAARVAHDIRNPLSAIKMQAQLLQARLRPNADDQATLAAILHDINQVESVIRDLVDLARPGELTLEPASINTVVEHALEQLAAQFTYRKIAVRSTFASGLPPVALDRTRFRQALLNVLVNASEAMPTGGEIVVETRLEQAAVVIEICDDGVGIDPALYERVFDPFVSTKREGVGLGLVNAKAVVEGHGGRISLAPRQPHGTCAHITIPLHG